MAMAEIRGRYFSDRIVSMVKCHSLVFLFLVGSLLLEVAYIVDLLAFRVVIEEKFRSSLVSILKI